MGLRPRMYVGIGYSCLGGRYDYCIASSPDLEPQNLLINRLRRKNFRGRSSRIDEKTRADVRARYHARHYRKQYYGR